MKNLRINYLVAGIILFFAGNQNAAAFLSCKGNNGRVYFVHTHEQCDGETLHDYSKDKKRPNWKIFAQKNQPVLDKTPRGILLYELQDENNIKLLVEKLIAETPPEETRRLEVLRKRRKEHALNITAIQQELSRMDYVAVPPPKPHRITNANAEYECVTENGRFQIPHFSAKCSGEVRVIGNRITSEIHGSVAEISAPSANTPLPEPRRQDSANYGNPLIKLLVIGILAFIVKRLISVGVQQTQVESRTKTQRNNGGGQKKHASGGRKNRTANGKNWQRKNSNGGEKYQQPWAAQKSAQSKAESKYFGMSTKELWQKIMARVHPDRGGEQACTETAARANAAKDSGDFRALCKIAASLGIEPTKSR